jgi:hypothetical protein
MIAGVILLSFRGGTEEARDLRIAFHIRLCRKGEIAMVGIVLAVKGVIKIIDGFVGGAS